MLEDVNRLLLIKLKKLNILTFSIQPKIKYMFNFI